MIGRSLVKPVWWPLGSISPTIAQAARQTWEETRWASGLISKRIWYRYEASPPHSKAAHRAEARKRRHWLAMALDQTEVWFVSCW
jgi:hypothetical protein